MMKSRKYLSFLSQQCYKNRQYYYLRTVFRFSSLKNLHDENNKVFYPYLFGGLKRGDIVQNPLSKFLLKKYFDKNTFEGFKQAYKAYLSMLVEKDTQSLKEIIELSILQKTTFKNVQLINPDAQIQIICGHFFFVFGGGFDRRKYSYLKFGPEYKQNPNRQLSFEQKLFNEMFVGRRILQIRNEQKPKSQPFLIVFNIMFRSKMKLIPQGTQNQQNTLQQIHCLQFEIQKMVNSSFWSAIKSFLTTFVKCKFDMMKSIQLSAKKFIGQSYQWRVGDVDKLLDKNLKLRR